MNVKKNSSHSFGETVRAKTKSNAGNITRNISNYKHHFNRSLLPSPITYYSKKIEQFHPKKYQATGLCPFHREKNPSFSINLKRGAFFCFSCGKSGSDIIDFHMKYNNLSFIEACKDLGVWNG